MREIIYSARDLSNLKTLEFSYSHLIYQDIHFLNVSWIYLNYEDIENNCVTYTFNIVDADNNTCAFFLLKESQSLYLNFSSEEFVEMKIIDNN